MLIMLLTGIMALGLTACSNDEEGQLAKNEVKVCFIYTLDTSNGNSMTRATNNETVFNEFYEKIKTGELVAPTYDLTLTEVNTGATYSFKGRWASHDLVTLRTGTYHVVGTSKAEGDNVQEKCSFTFDEQIDISITSSTVTLHANYDCSLLIFNNAEIQSLQNYNGESLSPFFTFSTYRYAFVNDQLYLDNKRSDAYILGQYTSNAEFKVFTGSLDFEKGKYYVYNSVSNGFDVPPMDEGSISLPKDLEAVDLGLPSGTLWANMNVGATKPEEYGLYFAWGETIGYANDDPHVFNWENYKYCKGSERTLTKYCYDSSYGYNGFTDNLTELELSDDAAYVNWGTNWRMPNDEQCLELINSSYTTSRWTTQNGVNGRLITSKSNGNSIFLPASGSYEEDGWRNTNKDGTYGDYLSRTLGSKDFPNTTAKILACYNTSIWIGEWGRQDGRSVRPVRNTKE